MKYLVLKLTPERLEEYCKTGNMISNISKGWRITNKKAKNIETALIYYNGCIVRVMTVRHQEEHDGKMDLDLVDVLAHDLVGRRFKYPTSNPASTITEEKLDMLLHDMEEVE